MSVKTLRDLVHSKVWLTAETTVEETLQFLNDKNVQYVPVVQDKRIVGMVNRALVQNKLASQFGWSLLAKKPITALELSKPLLFQATGKTLELMNKAIQRPIETVYDDVILIDNGSYVGLVSVKQLMIYQLRSFDYQMERIRQQNELMKKALNEVMPEGRLVDTSVQTELFEPKTLKPIDFIEANHTAQQSDPTFAGRLEQFHPTDVVQIVHQGRKSGLLEIRDEEGQLFQVYFRDGRAVHAEGGGCLGKFALWELQRCAKGSFQFFYHKASPLKTIEEETMYLLIEGCRIMEEDILTKMG